jgi:pyruvate kinase
VRITSAQISATDTTLGVQNNGSGAVDLSGWRLRVGTATATLPANSRVAPGETVTIHTASGTSGGRDIYIGADAAALISALQPGASVALVDAQGATVSEFVLPR